MGPPLAGPGGQPGTAAPGAKGPPASAPGGAKGAATAGSSAGATRLAAAGEVPVPVVIPRLGRAPIVAPSALVVYSVQKAVFDSITALVVPQRPRREDP